MSGGSGAFQTRWSLGHQQQGDHVLTGKYRTYEQFLYRTFEFLSQATHINFICPMRFDAFPLDTQVTITFELFFINHIKYQVYVHVLYTLHNIQFPI